MPCNWSTTASLLLRVVRTAQPHLFFLLTARRSSACGLPSSSVVSKRAVLSSNNPYPHTPITFARHFRSWRPHPCRVDVISQVPSRSRPQYLPPSTSHSLTRSLPVANRSEVRCFGTTPARNTNPSENPSPSLSATTAHLSDAQVSRVTAQAVRLCIRDGDFGDALYVVNSACHSVLRDPLHTQDPQEQNSTSKLEPIAFGRPVSPRLAAHAFLHGLVRKGYASKAQTYAKLMVRAGIPIHSATMEAVIASVRTSSSILPRFGPFARVIPRRGRDVLQLQPGKVKDACARAAIELLQTARTFGQRRTERMYHVLISTLLMQGEIIVATLLFALLMKDWEVSKNHASTPDGAKDWISYEHLGQASPLPAVLSHTPYPDLKAMGDILATIDKVFARMSDSTSDPAIFPYLQSLAVFAMFLDTGQLHTHRTGSLIRTMYHCPKTNARVWILRDGEMVSVKAYPYFHEVLKRLVNSLGDRPKRVPPTLSRRSYNALLSYSLRHQLSPGMARKVLNHMCVKRSPPIAPDIATYNVLLRAGTLLRQLCISEAALAALRSGSAKLSSASLNELLSQEPAPVDTVNNSQAIPSSVATSTLAASPGSSHSPSDLPPSNFTAALTRLETETFNLPQKVASPGVVPRVNTFTLTSFVTHLTSTGRSESIVPVLFDILPELFIIDHPATNGVAVRQLLNLSRQDALRRAAQHGPYVYSSLINAMAKAGEVGLAERVFILAQQAERASYVPSFGAQPWRLPVEAYTSMLQCYTRVVHGRLPKHKRSQHYLGALLLERDSAWQPKAGHYRQGYAQYVYRMQMRKRVEGLTQRQRGRRNAMLLYRSMMSGGRSLLQQMILSHTSRPMATTTRRAPTGGEPSWFVLLPDERFFNAALKLFSRPARRRSIGTHTAAEQDETLRARCPPLLRQLAIAIINNGYSIPERYHRQLVRGWKGPMTVKRPRRSHVRRPYAFPPMPADSARGVASIPTVKTRGLPMRRKMPAWMRRRRTRTK
ncbi:hypothetical protein L226DRAFT_508987 [Lentinus tigrinus ALCF2SS1-7]|uniref:Pentacotripeptide-repeat region of PRORP domain-containing protein n=1 Tax=Lentinus tigrinus ALCF2SS1-6 TaxID=1328759 RepID=A0A5C2SKS8_9APHY|nr:hypothetical protein L227DRAFT_523697 [Lentinus tigrinus ALCF2SS1-6]RPD74574.1 hypothetical protein L226DRAFT_508987 [Lentinus tigrinus ALCF2SS1-7]